MKIVPAPSPNGTNHEHMYLFKLPARRAAGAYDGAPGLPGTNSKVELEKILCELLSGHELQRAKDLLHSIDAGDGEESMQEETEDEEGENVEIEVEEAEDEEVRRRADRIADHLREHGLGEDDLEEARPLVEKTIRDAMRRRGNGRDQHLPGNALHGGAGGRLSEARDRKRARDRRLAADAKQKQLAFDRRYPYAAGLRGGSLVETAYGDQPPARRVAVDGDAEKSFAERFPGAARIGSA